MSKPLKSVKEKLQTRISKIKDEKVKVTATRARVGQQVLFTYSPDRITYSKLRYFPSLKDDLVEEDFDVVILLDHKTLNILSSAVYKPPRGASRVIDMVRYLAPNVNRITIGGNKNKIEVNTVFVTFDLYETLNSINQEEGRDKVIRVRNRVAPFLKENFALEGEEEVTDRDYSLLMKELIVSKEFSQEDIAAMVNQLESGETNEIVIERQINKQAEWLLSSIQTIIDEPELNKAKAQNLGKRLFHFPKSSISGPEDLMEKILTKYGQNIIFGVPALLNVDSYVTSKTGLPRSQFDIILITPLSDVEIVELKRPDDYLFEFDHHRGKFYMSKTLGVAAAQSERYISAIYRENDKDFKMDGKTIREYIDSQIGGTVSLSICRPKALIVIGTIQRLVKPYDLLPSHIKSKFSKKSYNHNLDHAYKELKASFKNVEITTYSELLEGARLRLQLSSEK